jgi:hypothetical protein
MSFRDSMRESVTAYLKPGEPVQSVIGAQTRSQYLMFTGLFPFFNRFRILAVTPQRILVLDTGKFSTKKALGVVTELPRSTRLGPGSGVWHVIPVGHEKLRVHRAYFKDLQTADSALG